MAVSFYIDKRTDKKGDAPIRVSISVKGVRYLTSTGLKVAPAKWDGDRQRARKGVSNASGMTWAVLNRTLDRISEHFTEFEIRCQTENVSPSSAMLKAEFAREFGRKGVEAPQEVSAPGFWDYYRMFIDERSVTNQWTVATHQKFNALREHLKGWRAEPSFDDFTDRGFAGFITYLRTARHMKNSTIGKQLGFLKWFLRWATLKGYNSNTAYQTFSPKLKSAPKQVVFLEWDELMRVFNYEVPAAGTVVRLRRADGSEYDKTVHFEDGLRTTRDVFCFCCFTSLRFSDAANLKRSNIKGEAMTITTVKTADTVTIELNKYARAVLDRYAGVDLGAYALPRITNQRMNMYLKELCELCGINRLVTQTYYKGNERFDETLPMYELVGTHTGRRTFICNALMLGIPAEIVMKWTGHADYKSMKPYIDVADKAKAKAMQMFDKL